MLALVQQRLTNGEIADRLFVSVRTVETHVSALLRKLGAADRRALARRPPAATTVDRPSVVAADPADDVRRTDGGAGRARRCGPVASSGHCHWPRRRRQDPIGARRRRGCRRRVRARCGVRRPREGDATGHGRGCDRRRVRRARDVGCDAWRGARRVARRRQLPPGRRQLRARPRRRPHLARAAAHRLWVAARPGHQQAAADAAVRARRVRTGPLARHRRRQRRGGVVHRADGRCRCRPPERSRRSGHDRGDLRRPRGHGAGDRAGGGPGPRSRPRRARRRARVAPGHPRHRRTSRRPAPLAACGDRLELRTARPRRASGAARRGDVRRASRPRRHLRRHPPTITPGGPRRAWLAWSTGTWRR